MKKSIFIFMLILTMLCMSFSVCMATGFIQDTSVTPPGEEVKNAANTAIQYLRFAGFAIAMGMIAFVGIKYLMSSAEERASMKGVLVKVVAGACIVALATPITEFIIHVVGDE